MTRLDMQQRRALSPDDYVFPERAPGHGSYPIPDRGHAEAALRFAAGTADEGRVRAAVCKKFQIGCSGVDAEDRRDGGADEASEKS